MPVDTNYFSEEISISSGSALPAVVRLLRNKKGMTQQQIADSLGITQKTMSSLERRSDVANFSRIVQLLSLLDAELVIKSKS